jgi:cyclopropane fatty-acyl-phospholipid synthase-like methyltransferase
LASADTADFVFSPISVTGQFDRVVSVGMMETAGPSWNDKTREVIADKLGHGAPA